MEKYDLKDYRRYMKIEYGDIAPEVKIPLALPDMSNISNLTRTQYSAESISNFNHDMRQLYIYPKLMRVSVAHKSVLRDGYNIPVRVYSPEGGGRYPLMVFFHGGGFMLNNLEVYDYVHRYLAAFGKAVVVTVDYRLAPENKFPTGVEDCYAGLEWAVKNAIEFGADISSVTVCGDSAGGNLTAVISLLARDRKGPKIHKQVIIYPVVVFNNKPTYSELRYAKGYYLEERGDISRLSNLFDDPEQEIMSPYASPLLAESHKDLPPAVFISAECDPLVDQALIYAAKLQDAGVPVEFHLYKGMLHAFINETYGKSFEALNTICASIPPIK